MNTSASLPTPDQVRDYIAQGLACTLLEVQGDGRHFDAIIISSEFEGLRMVARHQRVYAVLGDRMKEEIHAISLKTYTPAEFEAMQNS